MSAVGTKLIFGPKLKKSFYLKPAEVVARKLLGKVIVKKERNFFLAGRIVETEAYLGAKDRASHAFGYKKTPRTQIMFAEGGIIYVYRIYGLCWCFNIVAGKENDPQSVFIRALEPLAGIKTMLRRRKNKNLALLTNGPCRWTESFKINQSFYGRKIYANKDLFIAEDKSFHSFKIKRAKRIGIDYAQEAKDWLLRFYLEGNKFVTFS